MPRPARSAIGACGRGLQLAFPVLADEILAEAPADPGEAVAWIAGLFSDGTAVLASAVLRARSTGVPWRSIVAATGGDPYDDTARDRISLHFTRLFKKLRPRS